MAEIKEYKSVIEVLEDFGNEMQKDMRDYLKSNNAYVSGDLSQSITFSAKILGTQFKFNLSVDEFYADYVNKGVNGTQRNLGSPYSFKNNFPSKKHVGALTRWAMEKGIATGKEAKRFGYLAARKQKRFGMPATPFWDKTVTQDRLDKLQKDLTKAAGEDVNTLVLETARGIFGVSR
jgi:hypothetical protein